MPAEGSHSTTSRRSTPALLRPALMANVSIPAGSFPNDHLGQSSFGFRNSASLPRRLPAIFRIAPAPIQSAIGSPNTACGNFSRHGSGVEPKAGPAGRIGDSRCMKDRKIDAGEAGGSEPPRRLSGRRCGALREAVPGEVRAGSAGAPARVPGASRPAVRGSRRSGRCTCAKHSAQAVSASANGEPRACAGEAGARRAKRGGERGAKRARGCCGCRRTSVNIVRRRLKRERNGPRHRSGAARVRLRPRCAQPEFRAALPCRRGSR